MCRLQGVDLKTPERSKTDANDPARRNRSGAFDFTALDRRRAEPFRIFADCKRVAATLSAQQTARPFNRSRVHEKCPENPEDIVLLPGGYSPPGITWCLHRRQARFAVLGIARKVRVVGSNVTRPAGAGVPVISGSASLSPSARLLPFSSMVLLRRSLAWSV